MILVSSKRSRDIERIIHIFLQESSKFGFEEDVGIPSKGSERRRLLIERTSALSVAAVLNSRWNGFSSAGSFSIKLHLFLSLRNAPDASLISSYWRARTPTVRILDPDRTVSTTV